MVKRLFDIFVVVLIAVPAGVLCLAVALAVRATSPGPVLYWSNRVGVGNRLFAMPKFRTMRVDTPEVATHQLSSPGRWVTPVGAFLRRSSFDELPQLWSVLVGDMSLVGPRPALHSQADLIDARQKRGVDRIRPGITGWAQINGRDDLPIGIKVEYDSQYLQRQSLAFDLKILFLTVAKVVRSEGVSH